MTHRVQLLTVALACLGIGAGASAIAGADAHSAARRTAHNLKPGRVSAIARRTVAGSLVVATRSGFVDVSVARGQVQAVNGQTLTIAEGTRKHVYRTVSVTLPANVTVHDNRKPATLSQVLPGQRVLVITGPDRAIVRAHTAHS